MTEGDLPRKERRRGHPHSGIRVKRLTPFGLRHLANQRVAPAGPLLSVKKLRQEIKERLKRFARASLTGHFGADSQVTDHQCFPSRGAAAARSLGRETQELRCDPQASRFEPRTGRQLRARPQLARLPVMFYPGRWRFSATSPSTCRLAGESQRNRKLASASGSAMGNRTPLDGGRPVRRSASGPIGRTR